MLTGTNALAYICVVSVCVLLSGGLLPYAEVLLDLVRRRGFEIFVHPIPPVLNETRHVVMPFNQQLKQRVSLCFSAHVSKSANVWL